jgi:hypothetical protein
MRHYFGDAFNRTFRGSASRSGKGTGGSRTKDIGPGSGVAADRAMNDVNPKKPRDWTMTFEEADVGTIASLRQSVETRSSDTVACRNGVRSDEAYSMERLGRRVSRTSEATDHAQPPDPKRQYDLETSVCQHGGSGPSTTLTGPAAFLVV